MRLDLSDQDAEMVANILQRRLNDYEFAISYNPRRRGNKISEAVIDSFKVECDAIRALLARMGRAI